MTSNRGTRAEHQRASPAARGATASAWDSRRWLLPVFTAAGVVGLAVFGGFLMLAGLDVADKIASIVGVFIALITGGAAIVGWLMRNRPTEDRPSPWGIDVADLVNETGPAGSLPDWPQSFPGYNLGVQGNTTVRVFGGEGGLATIPGFPATMNGCAHQRFLIRWRSLGDVPIAASLVSAPDLITVEPAAYGTAGWMSSHGCGQPAWGIVHDDSRIEDISVTWQVWVPTA
ncbi:hypothetical protein [Plantactinospora endophytica]|uniref:Uncharacterized protein n=1 Tax=Plantactinospora endophytica TaxID=673535 RepID=A0ABQ4EEM8_9ACTN|nr:hypothetical protein [Plantactinospora endophytica]GIG93168.1 hypothetical protein Pen02_81040 [Plantactinospora endophytica]